jgi:propanol-preferring alcohol dehydrogenase
MRVILLNKPAPIEDRPLYPADIPVPKPAADEILIKVTVCGACHTDIDEAEGRLETGKTPVVPGHQVVGVVAEKASSAEKFQIGDRVGVTWLYSSCGKCEFCKRGNENLCETARWTGKDADGGYAEYMTIGQDFAYMLPDGFSDLQAAPLLCAGVVGYRALRLADIQDGQVVGMYGFGACAHILIRVIKNKFPNSPVYVFTKTQEHIDLAKSLGADWTGRSGDKPPALLDKAMDFTPVGECIRDAMDVLQRGGRLVINAIRKETPVPPLDYARYLWLEKEIKSVANVTKADAEEFLPIAAEIGIEPTTEEFPLADANEVLIKIKHSQLKAAAVLRI